jgi:bifunctional UDP-N-acetylglucosamine pyrophosphorylase / glucosamine-1-phosphate N-acetyltransferase
MSEVNWDKVGVVILAAGDGVRMNGDKPKVMLELDGKPLVEWVVDEVKKIKGARKPVVVVSPKHNLVKDRLQQKVEYALQQKKLGTADAVTSAESVLKDRVDDVVVLYGDMPYITDRSIKDLVKRHKKDSNDLTLVTIKVPDFNGLYEQFKEFGRVIRNENGEAVTIVETKDASEDELTETLLNTSYFCFKASWLWANLKKIKNENAQLEYYLTDLLSIGSRDKANIGTLNIHHERYKEAIGINTLEDLKAAEKLIPK